MHLMLFVFACLPCLPACQSRSVILLLRLCPKSSEFRSSMPSISTFIFCYFPPVCNCLCSDTCLRSLFLSLCHFMSLVLLSLPAFAPPCPNIVQPAPANAMQCTVRPTAVSHETGRRPGMRMSTTIRAPPQHHMYTCNCACLACKCLSLVVAPMLPCSN